MTAQQVIEYIENSETFDDFAFRGDDFIPAKSFRKSRYHGDDGPEYELKGVSSIKVADCQEQYIIEAMEQARKYGDNLFLLQGRAINADDENHDHGECLMTSHKIICIVR